MLQLNIEPQTVICNQAFKSMINMHELPDLSSCIHYYYTVLCVIPYEGNNESKQRTPQVAEHRIKVKFPIKLILDV